jgi:2-succinyl-5-enolpyruvyl-6-hydroxy-3-cyclohexene-1-carboxylate synthase
LVYAAVESEARGELTLTVRTDERVAGFLALGWSVGVGQAVQDGSGVFRLDDADPPLGLSPRETSVFGSAASSAGLMAGVATTSGTAVANLHPAVVEAAESRRALIVISADRPAELHQVGANQTTDQRGLFGAAPVWYQTLPAGLDDQAARAAGLAAAQAAAGKLSGVPGPAHINIQFREPLVPSDWPDQMIRARRAEAAPRTRLREAALTPPTIRRPGPPDGSSGQFLPVVLEHGRLTLVLAGFGAGPAAAALAEAAGWPLIAEPVSGSWGGPNAVPAGRLVADVIGHRVERLVIFGRPVLSRPITRLISDPRIESIVVHPGGGAWFDLGPRSGLVVGSVAVAAVGAADCGPGLTAGDGKPLADQPGGPVEQAWLNDWLALGSDLCRHLVSQPFPNGPAVAWLAVRAALPQGWPDLAGSTGRGGADRTGGGPAGMIAGRVGGGLVVGSSSAIRDLDLVPPPTRPNQAVAALRGAAGIDGTISFATGLHLANAEEGPTRVLLGDLALAHDSGALLLPTLERKANLQVIALVDGGGGIFESLEPSGPGLEPAFERFFTTPVTIDLEHLAAAYGASYYRTSSAEELRATLDSPPPGISLVEVRLARWQRQAGELQAVELSRQNPQFHSMFAGIDEDSPRTMLFDGSARLNGRRTP